MQDKIREMLNTINPKWAYEDGVDFMESGYLDSLDIMTLIEQLEEAFSISVSPYDVVEDNFRTVAAIEALVNKSEKA